MPSHPQRARPSRISEAETGHIARKMYDLACASLSPAQKLDIFWPADGDGPYDK